MKRNRRRCRSFVPELLESRRLLTLLAEFPLDVESPWQSDVTDSDVLQRQLEALTHDSLFFDSSDGRDLLPVTPAAMEGNVDSGVAEAPTSAKQAVLEFELAQSGRQGFLNNMTTNGDAFAKDMDSNEAGVTSSADFTDANTEVINSFLFTGADGAIVLDDIPVVAIENSFGDVVRAAALPASEPVSLELAIPEAAIEFLISDISNGRGFLFIGDAWIAANPIETGLPMASPGEIIGVSGFPFNLDFIVGTLPEVSGLGALLEPDVAMEISDSDFILEEFGVAMVATSGSLPLPGSNPPGSVVVDSQRTWLRDQWSCSTAESAELTHSDLWAAMTETGHGLPEPLSPQKVDNATVIEGGITERMQQVALRNAQKLLDETSRINHVRSPHWFHDADVPVENSGSRGNFQLSIHVGQPISRLHGIEDFNIFTDLQFVGNSTPESPHLNVQQSFATSPVLAATLTIFSITLFVVSGGREEVVKTDRRRRSFRGNSVTLAASIPMTPEFTYA